MLLLVLLLTPFALAWSGFVLTILWGWFVVPAFGLAPLSVPVAIGLSTIIGMYMKVKIDDEAAKTSDEKAKEVITSIVVAAVKPAWLLLIGWIVTLFM